MNTIILETQRLIIRNWQAADRHVFFQLNSDPTVMHFFPAIKSQSEADALMINQMEMIEQTGFGFYALELKEPHKDNSKKTIGMCGLLKTDLEPFIAKNSVEIGWRLLPEYWGFGYITEAANAILTYGFDILKLSEVISFAVQDNQRSIKVMERIGMTHLVDKDFAHPRVPDSHPHLKQHVLYQKTNPHHVI